jgi:hypothetical protein
MKRSILDLDQGEPGAYNYYIFIRIRGSAVLGQNLGMDLQGVGSHKKEKVITPSPLPNGLPSIGWRRIRGRWLSLFRSSSVKDFVTVAGFKVSNSCMRAKMPTTPDSRVLIADGYHFAYAVGDPVKAGTLSTLFR